MSRYFTLDEAVKRLPEVESGILQAIEARRELQSAELEWRTFADRVVMMGGITVDRASVRETQDKQQRSAGRLDAILTNFERIGCVVKDLDIGLIDFPSLYQGREVYLCWRLGETGIHFWHGVEEGFAGRKPIDDSFIRELGSE